MHSIMGWLRRYWWILLSIVIVLFLLAVSIVNCKSMNDIVETFLKYLNDFVRPFGIIAGLILGYPLLKRKLVETYISKQLEKISEANEILRQRCLKLMRKYPLEYISTHLTEEYFEELLQDYESLWDDAVKANIDAYKYYKLVLDGLSKFADRIKRDKKVIQSGYYNETLSSLLNTHLQQIYRYASVVSFSDKTVKRTKLVDRLKKYVSENNDEVVEDLDFSQDYKIDSAMLILFFETTIRKLDKGQSTLLECFYLSAPTPIPFVRIMYNREIYAPPTLIRKKDLLGLELKLVLIGMNSRKSIMIDSGKKKLHYSLIYANVSQVGFRVEDISDFKDDYLDLNFFGSCGKYECSIINRSSTETSVIQIGIDTESLQKQFRENKRKIKKQMTKDRKKSSR